MRISVEPDQPGYIGDRSVTSAARIFLDGMETKGVMTADEERGFVRRYKMTHDGKIVHDTDGNPVLERVNGIVRIVGVPA